MVASSRSFARLRGRLEVFAVCHLRTPAAPRLSRLHARSRPAPHGTGAYTRRDGPCGFRRRPLCRPAGAACTASGGDQSRTVRPSSRPARRDRATTPPTPTRSGRPATSCICSACPCAAPTATTTASRSRSTPPRPSPTRLCGTAPSRASPIWPPPWAARCVPCRTCRPRSPDSPLPPCPRRTWKPASYRASCWADRSAPAPSRRSTSRWPTPSSSCGWSTTRPPSASCAWPPPGPPPPTPPACPPPARASASTLCGRPWRRRCSSAA